jgi:hypothetical protein
MASTTDVLDLHSTASAVSGVTESTPSATGGPFEATGPPAVSASRRRACELFEPLEVPMGRSTEGCKSTASLQWLPDLPSVLQSETSPTGQRCKSRKPRRQ